MKQLQYALFILLMLLLSNCDMGQREVGKVKVKGINGIYFVIYQHDEFDSATALYYEIVNAYGEVISDIRFLSGTLDYIENTDSFSAGVYDSIVYLTSNPKTRVVVMYDLKDEGRLDPISTRYEKMMDERDSLFRVINSYNSELTLK